VINEDRATTEDDDAPKLVVHDGGSAIDDQPTVVNEVPPPLAGSQEAVTRTVYLHAAPGPPETASHSARLAVTFLTCFAGTTFFVLFSWGLITLNRPARPPPAPPEVRVVEIEKPVPVPMPVPIAAAPIPEPPAAPRPRPRPRRTVAPPPPAPVEVAPPEVEVAPTPMPVVEAPPPVPPTPAPAVPTAAMLLSGTYSGKSAGEDVVIDLAFRAEGVVEATIRRPGGGPTTTAIGDYEIDGRQATIMLMERGVTEPLVYTGTVGVAGAEGRVTSGTRNVGRFSAGR